MGRLDRADGKERELKGVTNPQRRSCRSVEGGGCRSRPVQGGMRRLRGAPPGLGQVYACLPCAPAGPGRMWQSGGLRPLVRLSWRAWSARPLFQHAGPGAAAAPRVGRDGNQKRKCRGHALVERGGSRGPPARDRSRDNALPTICYRLSAVQHIRTQLIMAGRHVIVI